MLNILFFLFLFSGMSFSKDQIIPKEVLFGNPDKMGVQISPDGKCISYVAPVNGVLNIWVKYIDKRSACFAVTKSAKRSITNYSWLNDGQHMVYMQDKDGDENWHLYRINVFTRQVVDLTPFDGVQARVVHYSKRHPYKILVSLNKDNKNLHDVYDLNLSTGKFKLIAKNMGNVIGWVADRAMQIRLALRTCEDGGREILMRDDNKSEWSRLIKWDFDDAYPGAATLFGFAGYDTVYLADSTGSNTARLVKMNMKTKKKTVIAEDPDYDISNIFCHPDTHKLISYSFYKAKNERVLVDKSYQDDFDRLKKLDDGELGIAGWDDIFNRWVVTFSKDDKSTAYYLYDRRYRKAEFLFYIKSDINKYKLAPMKPISFKARDGLAVHGYLTMPNGAKQDGTCSMVLMVHGGPWTRDGWGANPYAQFFANRGYACMQINYRGSTGYGKKFLNAGNKEWGRKMHYDLLDGVNWAVENKIVNAKKVAIYGGSYGGYAALVGAAMTPDVFCCAIDLVGPSNLVTLLKSFPPYWKAFVRENKLRIGDVETEEEFLKERSPLFHVDKIKIPVLVVQGANDPRVKQAEAEQIVAAMKERGIPHEYMLFADEGHGLARPHNRLKFITKMEQFLADNLGGNYEG